MAYEYGKTKIQLRRDTAANLSAVVLDNGEPAYATDTQVLKIGNGSDSFSALAGIAGGGISDLTGDSVNQRLEYTNESGVISYVDLAWTMDDTNLARLVSGTINSSGIATFERDDATTFTVDFSSLFDGDITSVTAGTGLSGGGTTGDITLNIDSTVIQSGDNVSQLVNDAAYITGYVETDPVFGASVASIISSGDISNWNESYSWGDHSSSGYLVSGNNVSLLNNDVPYLTNITGLDTTNFDSSTVVTEADGISSNDNDTTLPTSAAVKDYVDNNTVIGIASDTGVAGGGTSIANIVIIASSDYSGITPDTSTLYFVTG